MDSSAVPTGAALRDALKTRLPEYMIPASFLVLDELPLTPSGKVDRKALPQSQSRSISTTASVEAPRDRIEEQVLQIWEELLTARPLGIQSNFFHVGGHSLLVVKLFARINKQFHCSLPVGAIFASPTVEQLARLIRGRSIDSADDKADISEHIAKVGSAIVPIKEHGSAPPLFLIHGGFGHIVGFHELAALTGTEHPIYGIMAQSLLHGQPALLRIEDQASYYLKEIRKIQPEGPYYFLGYCYGGVVAYEMAQQLRARGERVEMLGMLDAFLRGRVPQVDWRSPEIPQNRMARFKQNTRKFSRGRKLSYVAERLLARIFKPMTKAAFALGLPSVPSFMKITEDINALATRKYEARPWAGTITLFRAVAQPHPEMPWDLGWSAVAEGGVEVIDVPGGHFALLHEPNVQTLAARLRKRLERRDAAATPEIVESTNLTS
jgi:thioesterase domain-containing protein